MKYQYLILLLFSSVIVNSQIINKKQIRNDVFLSDSTRFNKEIKVQLDGETKFTDYKIISYKNDTTYVDTTLTAQKDYKFNYIRKDDFELLPFHNLGQTYNKLVFDFSNSSILPKIGFSAKQYNYKKISDIYYYYVPTPTTEIMYKTALEQGQMLDAFLTLNTSRQLNLSIGYKGLRSLGKYRSSLASHGNFNANFNYTSKNKQYKLRGHFYSYDLMNNENGGLTDTSIAYFENNDPNYTDRARLETNFNDAENMFEGKRYYIDHNYILINRKKAVTEGIIDTKTRIQLESISIELNDVKNDSIQRIDYLKTIDASKLDSLVEQDSIYEVISDKLASLKRKKPRVKLDSTDIQRIKNVSDFKLIVGNSLSYETSHYRFTQTSPSSIFGTTFTGTTKDHTHYSKMNIQAFAGIKSTTTGTLRGKINYFDYNYHYNSILFTDNGIIPNNLKGNAILVGADWKTSYGKFNLEADASTILSGDLNGNSIKATIGFKKDSVYDFKGFISIVSKTAELNKILFQSNYEDYNWNNDLKNEAYKTIGAKFELSKYGNITASYNIIDNYSYFDENSKVTQASTTLNYLKAKLYLKLSSGKFTLENTFQYQKVDKGNEFFRVPELLTRNTFYFSDYVFKGDPMYLQTGITFKYFSSFKANAYNPLLSEFILQNNVEIGNYPMLDFFLNAQIQRTRLYLKIENFTASFTGRKYYSAPNYPYRDLTVRFGLVWNFFI